jgi:hypothetical protein
VIAFTRSGIHAGLAVYHEGSGLCLSRGHLGVLNKTITKRRVFSSAPTLGAVGWKAGPNAPLPFQPKSARDKAFRDALSWQLKQMAEKKCLSATFAHSTRRDAAQRNR